MSSTSPPRSRIVPGTPTLERFRSSKLIAGRSFQVVLDWAHRPGDEGVLTAHGGQAAGSVLYVEDGALHFEQNAYGWPRSLPPVPLEGESSQIVLDVRAPGGGMWEVGIVVDGTRSVEDDGFVQLAGFLPVEGIDVGIDRSPVSWALYQRRGTFAYTGTIHGAAYRPGEHAPDAGPLGLEQARSLALRRD